MAACRYGADLGGPQRQGGSRRRVEKQLRLIPDVFHFLQIFQYSSSAECVCIFNEAVASEQFQAEQDFGPS